MLSKIWDVGWRTARLCAHETYMDTPYWEQLQYVGDTRIQALLSLYVGGDDRLVKNAIELFDESRMPDGLTQSRYPTMLPQIIPPFSLFWIGMMHDLYTWGGDDALARSAILRGAQRDAGLVCRAARAVGAARPARMVELRATGSKAPASKTASRRQTTAASRSMLSLQFVLALREAADLECGGRQRRTAAVTARPPTRWRRP